MRKIECVKANRPKGREPKTPEPKRKEIVIVVPEELLNLRPFTEERLPIQQPQKFDYVKNGLRVSQRINEVQEIMTQTRNELHILEEDRNRLFEHTAKRTIRNKAFLAFAKDCSFKDIKVLGEKNGLLIVTHKDQWNENYVYSAFPITKHKKQLVVRYHGFRDSTSWMGWKPTVEEIIEEFRWLEREFNYEKWERKEKQRTRRRL